MSNRGGFGGGRGWKEGIFELWCFHDALSWRKLWAAEGQSMEARERVERLSEKWKSDSGGMGNPRCTLTKYMWSGW